MKNRWIVLGVLVSLLLCFVAAAEEKDHPDFYAYLKSTYQEVESYDAYNNTGFAIVKKDDKSVLGCFEKTQSGWQLVFENEKAVPSNSRSSIYMDTEEVLFFSVHFDDDTWQSQDYRLKNGQWCLESAVDSYKVIYDTENTFYVENIAVFKDEEITLTKYLTDANDNVLSTKVLRPLPNVLAPEKLSLQTINNQDPMISGEGYALDETMQLSKEILQGLFEKTVVPYAHLPHTYIDGVNVGEWLLFIAEDSAGNRTLLCGAYEKGWSFTQSTPLPKTASFGIENFVTVVDLGDYLGAEIIRYNDGTWGVYYILSQEDLFQLFQNGLLGDNLFSPQPAIGKLQCNDITKINWQSLPKNRVEALAQLNTTGYATPNNPDKNDRLHLRKEPSKYSPSLGKYYNGTPLKVLQKKGEWTKVQVGYQEGWMMTKYLAFGESMKKVWKKLPSKQALHPVTPCYWFTKTGTRMEELWFDEAICITVVGVIEDEWYLVWDPLTNAFGKIHQSDLWDGNG